MQKDPKKIERSNYNECKTSAYLPKNIAQEALNINRMQDEQRIINSGVALVTSKVNEILGCNNKLTAVASLYLPRIIFDDTCTEKPNVAGFFNPQSNEIHIIKDKIAENEQARTKVFIHELIHFLSHNGRDDNERVSVEHSILEHNNIGFMRHAGLDIREGREGNITHDYFLSFNEAVTEQLSIDILPGSHETYAEYRGLLSQVIKDAVAQKLGVKDDGGKHVAWTEEQMKNYIYQCFFKGDLTGFSTLLQTIYREYNISEQQFGLMTSKYDLPSLIKQKIVNDHPDTPPPSSERIRLLVQQRLNSKTAKDYVTDVIDGGDPEDGGYGAEYDNFIKDHQIVSSGKYLKGYEIDSVGLIIYRDDAAMQLFNNLRSELDRMLEQVKHGTLHIDVVEQLVDKMLFEKYCTSMLSDGFRGFYIYKHMKFDDLKGRR